MQAVTPPATTHGGRSGCTNHPSSPPRPVRPRPAPDLPLTTTVPYAAPSAPPTGEQPEAGADARDAGALWAERAPPLDAHLQAERGSEGARGLHFHQPDAATHIVAGRWVWEEGARALKLDKAVGHTSRRRGANQGVSTCLHMGLYVRPCWDPRSSPVLLPFAMLAFLPTLPVYLPCRAHQSLGHAVH